jgi:inner membrane transporter RhtA
MGGRHNTTAGGPPPAVEQTGAALLMAALSFSIVSVGSALPKPVMDNYGALATTAGRLAWAGLILTIIVRPKIHQYGKAQWMAAVSLGIVIGLMTMAAYQAIARIPLGMMVAIDFLGPLTVAALGFRRGWRLGLPVLALAGVFLLVFKKDGWSADPIGCAYAFAAAILWAFHILLLRRIGSVFHGLEGLAISFVVAALVALPFGLTQVDFVPPQGLVLATAGLALLTPLIPYSLDVLVLRRLSPSLYGILTSTQPAIATVFGYLILNQVMSPIQLIGIALVILASMIGIASEPPSDTRQAQPSVLIEGEEVHP